MYYMIVLRVVSLAACGAMPMHSSSLGFCIASITLQLYALRNHTNFPLLGEHLSSDVTVMQSVVAR